MLDSDRNRSRYLVCVFLVALSMAVYWKVGRFDFLQFDDDLYVTGNPHVREGLTADGIFWAMTATDAFNWHPVTWISHMLDVEIFGVRAGGHHWTNVFLHVLNALLLFLVLFRMTGETWGSGFVAALFAIHPLHVESVAWVAERKDVLSAFFWMMATWSYLRYVDRPGVIRFLPVMAFFVLGLMSKPMVVTLPFVLLLLDFWPLRRVGTPWSGDRTPSAGCSPVSIAQALLEKAPLFILAAASCAVTYFVQKQSGAMGSWEVYPLGIRAGNAVVAYTVYLEKAIFPRSLAVFYPHPGNALPAWRIVASATVLLFLTFLAVRRLKRDPSPAVGWFWFLGTLVPVIGLVQVGGQATADRYTYIPLIGPFIALAWGIPALVRPWGLRPHWLALGAGAGLSALLAVSWFQIDHWRNSEALFRHAIEATKDNYQMHYNLGVVLAGEGKMDQAIPHFREALRIRPDYVSARVNLGNALAQAGMVDEAISHFREALRIRPDSVDILSNLGWVLFLKGEGDEAIARLREALAINPDFFTARYNLGCVLMDRGIFDGAVVQFREALRIKPRDPSVLSRLNLALSKRSR